MPDDIVIKTVVVNNLTITISTSNHKYTVLLKNNLSKSKQKSLLDLLTSDIALNKPSNVQGVLKLLSIEYFEILNIDEIELPPKETQYKIQVNNLVGRYINKVLNLQYIYLKDNLMYIEYSGGILVYYLGTDSKDSKYAEIYKSGVIKTAHDIINKVVTEKNSKSQTLLLTKLMEELESVLAISVIEVTNVF